MKKWMTLLAVAGLVFALAPAARAAEDDVIDSTTITASSTDVYRSWEPPNKAVDPAGTPGLTGAHPNEVHGINHNSDGQFRNYPPDATPTTIWLKFDLGANYPLKTLRVWNGGFFRLALPEGNGNSGVNEAELYYSSAADDPGDDSSVNWTLISTVNFAAVTGHNGATSGSFAVTDEIALNNIDARWFAIKGNSNHGALTITGIAEVQFIEGGAVSSGTLIILR